MHFADDINYIILIIYFLKHENALFVWIRQLPYTSSFSSIKSCDITFSRWQAYIEGIGVGYILMSQTQLLCANEILWRSLLFPI